MKSEHALTLEQDPGSDRLGPSDVIEIHRMHRQGVAWDAIAERMGTSRKNIQRTVQGRRHRDLHPMVRPELYEDTGRQDATTALHFSYTQEQIDEAWRIGQRAFMDHLLGGLTAQD